MKKRIRFISSVFIILYNIFLVGTAFAHPQDSLLLLIEETANNEEKVDLYNKIARLYTDTAFTKAQKFADLAYQLAVANAYPLGEAQSLYNKARSLAMNNENRASLPVIEEAVRMIEQLPNTKKKQANFLTLQGWINRRLSNPYAAIMLYEKAYAIHDSLKNEYGRATTLLNIGTIHNYVGDKELALDYYQKANKVNEKLNDKYGLVYSLTCIGYIHEEKEEFRTALTYYEEALEMAEDKKMIRSKSNILANMGVSYLKLKQFDESLTSFRKSRVIDLQLKDKRSVGYSDLYIAKNEFLQSKANKIAVLEKTYQTGVEFDDIELQRLSAENLSEMYTSFGFFEQALQQRILATQLQDSMLNQDIKLKVKSIEIKKQFENTQKQIQQEKREALLKTSLAYQTKTRNLLLVCLGILLLGGILLYKAYKTTFAIKEQLLIKNESLKKTEEQLLVKNESLKKTEERLALKNKDLEKHIELNVELEQFAYIASHDIKAPLRTISNFIGLLKGKYYAQASERDKPLFEFIENGAKSLNHLVDDLLEFSRANNHSLKLEPLNFKKTLQEVIQNLDFSITQSNAEIILENCDFSIDADQIKIKQILQNLISNALKFKDAQRHPIITIAAKETTDFYSIAVKDNGIGIAEEHFQEVFEKFARLNSQSKFEGSGLGLSICAKYIKKHQGEIWIERNEDFGVTFIFTIRKNLLLTKQVAETEAQTQTREVVEASN